MRIAASSGGRCRTSEGGRRDRREGEIARGFLNSSTRGECRLALAPPPLPPLPSRVDPIRGPLAVRGYLFFRESADPRIEECRGIATIIKYSAIQRDRE